MFAAHGQLLTSSVALPSFDAVGAGYTGSGTPSWLHNITGNGVAAFVSVDATAASPTVTAEVGSTAMTLAGPTPNYYPSGIYTYVYGFYLLNPPTGSQTISIACSGTHYIAACSMSFYGVSGFGSATTAYSNTATAPSMSVSSVANQIIAQAFAGVSTTFTAYNQTQKYNKAEVASTNLSFVMGYAVGTGSSLTFSATGTQQWGGIGIPIL